MPHEKEHSNTVPVQVGTYTSRNISFDIVPAEHSTGLQDGLDGVFDARLHVGDPRELKRLVADVLDNLQALLVAVGVVTLGLPAANIVGTRRVDDVQHAWHPQYVMMAAGHKDKFIKFTKEMLAPHTAAYGTLFGREFEFGQFVALERMLHGFFSKEDVAAQRKAMRKTSVSGSDPTEIAIAGALPPPPLHARRVWIWALGLWGSGAFGSIWLESHDIVWH